VSSTDVYPVGPQITHSVQVTQGVQLGVQTGSITGQVGVLLGVGVGVGVGSIMTSQLCV